MSMCGMENGISPTQTQSSPFSISDILSNEVGQKKSPTSRHNISLTMPGSSTFSTPVSNASFSTLQLETPKRPRKGSSSGHSMARLALSEVGTRVAPSITTAYTENLNIQGSYESRVITPRKAPRSFQTSSSHVSPFNTNVLLALGQRPIPSGEEKEELFGDTSLGMLSEVAIAQYHSELSGAEGNSGLETPMRERLANIRIVSMTDDGSHEASKGEAPNASMIVRTRKILTPSILKRDKRRRVSADSPIQTSSHENSANSIRYNHTHLNAGFLSPNEKSSSNKELTFSPSIFLSRPDHFLSSPEEISRSSISASIPRPDYHGGDHRERRPSSVGSSSPDSESDCPNSAGSRGDSFITSTPIKGGKENMKGRSDSSEEGWSPTILHSKRHRHLTSRGESDSVKKPCLPPPQRRKSKARTKLSPLLENACSPITKDGSSHHHPSPLTTALATTPTKDMSISYPVPMKPKFTLPLSSPADPQKDKPQPALSQSSVPQPGVPVPCVPPQPSLPQPGVAVTHHPGFISSNSSTTLPSQAVSLGQKLFIPSTSSLPLHQSFIPLSQALLQQNALSKLQASFPYNPLASMCNGSAFPNYLPYMGLLPSPTPNYLSYSTYPSGAQFVSFNRGNTETSGVASNSRATINEGNRENQLQSVPPWFIFSNNRSQKRSRLTEAINKSLSEAPSQATKLPAEWTKVACGQTEDQRLLTEKARVFMQCRPRQLNFCDNEMD